MALTKVTRLTEGPLDFVRGTAGAAKTKIQGVGQAIGDIVRAGKQASVEGDAQSLQNQLSQAVSQMGQLVARYNEMNGQPSDENPQDEQRDNPMPADNGQQPLQQQTDNVRQNPQKQRQSRPSDATPAAFRTNGKPKGRNGPNGFEYTFDSFLQGTFNDDQHLDEGVWDFVKGAAQEGARKMIDHYQSKPSVLRDLYKAGVDASDKGKFTSVQKKIQAVANQIHALASKMGPQGEPAIKAAIQALPQPLQRATTYFLQQSAPQTRQEPTI